MEHELRKHIRNILDNMTNTKMSIWKKLSEIGIEMIIIIFAVSFAVFLERQREHSHEQQEVKEFLTGLRTDLENDVKEMSDDRRGYLEQAKWFKYFSGSHELDRDTVRRYSYNMWNVINLVVNNGRYEGFKASGKMNTIENLELRNSILDLYQETLISLTSNTSWNSDIKRDLQNLIGKFREDAGGPGDNILAVLKEREVRNFCLRLSNTSETVRRYDTAVAQSKRIISLIDKEYPR